MDNHEEKSIFNRLGFTPEEIYSAARKAYDEIIDFVTTPEFVAVFNEIQALPEQDRPKAVWNTLCDQNELKKRNIHPPDGILIQRSTFGDRRPTLFCVKKYLPEKFHTVIQNVNITIDNPHNESIPSDGQAFREPLPIELQSLAMHNGEGLQSIPDYIGVSMVDSNPYEKVDLIRGKKIS